MSREIRGAFTPLCPRVGAESLWEAQRPPTFLFLQQPQQPGPVRAPGLGPTAAEPPDRPGPHLASSTFLPSAAPRLPCSPQTPSLPSQTDPHCQLRGPQPPVDRALPSGARRPAGVLQPAHRFAEPLLGEGRGCPHQPLPATLALAAAHRKGGRGCHQLGPLSAPDDGLAAPCTSPVSKDSPHQPPPSLRAHPSTNSLSPVSRCCLSCPDSQPSSCGAPTGLRELGSKTSHLETT